MLDYYANSLIFNTSCINILSVSEPMKGYGLVCVNKIPILSQRCDGVVLSF